MRPRSPAPATVSRMATARSSTSGTVSADVRSGLCWTLMYPFKPPNLAAWGPAQVAEFTALGRRKLAECYGVLRGLATELAEESEEADA